MRKTSMRLISAALAACMMASTLPVGAFALEVGTSDAVAAVSEQEAETPAEGIKINAAIKVRMTDARMINLIRIRMVRSVRRSGKL